MKSLLLLVVWLAGQLTVRSEDDITLRCPRDLQYTSDMRIFGDLCYQFVAQEKFWYQARDYCLRNGGRLVKIDDPETNEFIINSLNDLWWRNKGVWIGLHDTNSELIWHWTGYDLYQNEPVRWTNWANGHPGAMLHRHRDCVRMVREGGQWKWHETFCNTWRWHYRFICEYKSYPLEADTINYNAQNTGMEPAVRFNQPNSDNRKLTGLDKIPETELLNLAEDHVHSMAAVESNEQQAEDESQTKYGGGGIFAVIFGCVLIGALASMIIFILYRRQRRANRNGESSCESATVSKGKDLDETAERSRSSRLPMAIANIYVATDDSEVVKSSIILSQENANDTDSCREDDEDFDDDDDAFRQAGLTSSDETLVGASGSRHSRRENVKYDVPKSTNLYSEIPDKEEFSENCHIYEALDEIQKY